MSGLDWREELHSLLINAGINGIKFAVIVKKLERLVTADEINEELEDLRVHRKAQRFDVMTGGRGRPAVVWRATTEIMK